MKEPQWVLCTISFTRNYKKEGRIEQIEYLIKKNVPDGVKYSVDTLVEIALHTDNTFEKKVIRDAVIRAFEPHNNEFFWSSGPPKPGEEEPIWQEPDYSKIIDDIHLYNHAPLIAFKWAILTTRYQSDKNVKRTTTTTVYAIPGDKPSLTTTGETTGNASKPISRSYAR